LLLNLTLSYNKFKENKHFHDGIEGNNLTLMSEIFANGLPIREIKCPREKTF